MRRASCTPDACISLLDRYVRRVCPGRVGSLVVCQAPSLEHSGAFECCSGRSKCDWEAWTPSTGACRGYTRRPQAWTRASLWPEVRTSAQACPDLDARMSPSVCFDILFLQLVLCASLKRSCVCLMIGASLLLFICIEVQLCSRSNMSSARIEPNRFWSEATHLS